MLGSNAAANWGNWSYVAGTGNDPRNRKARDFGNCSYELK